MIRQEDLKNFNQLAISLSRSQRLERDEMSKLRDPNTMSKGIQLNPSTVPPTKIVNLSSAIPCVTRKWSRGRVVFSTDAEAQARAPALTTWIEKEFVDKVAYFTKFNIRLQLPRLGEEAFRRKVQALDDDWSPEETNYLFEMLEVFEGNFVVINDRYDTSRFQLRTVEDLKARVFEVCQAMASERGFEALGSIGTARYDKEVERLRKLKTDKFSRRSEAVQRQEEHLLTEIRNLDIRIRKKERENRNFKKLIELSKEERQEFGAVAEPNSQLFEALEPPNSGVFVAYNRGRFIRNPVPTLPPLTNKKVEIALKDLGIPENLYATEANLQELNRLRVGLVKLFTLNLAITKKEEELKAFAKLKDSAVTDEDRAAKQRGYDKKTLAPLKKVKED